MANASAWSVHQFSVILTLVQVLLLVLFALFSTHAPEALPGGVPTNSHQVSYTDYQDIHIVLIVGFGFLAAFLRRYGFASFGISLLLTAVTIQWALILRGLMGAEFAQKSSFSIQVGNLVQADFNAVVVLISFGALIGKLSPIQYLVLALIEAPVSVVSEYIIVHKLHVQDVGGAVFVHVFGAIFGIVVSRILFKKQWQKSDDADSIYHSEVISFIGAAFLWVLWPSFNAVYAIGDARQRTIVNSYVALAASTVAAFLASQFINKTHHFNIRHIVSASLAGGVAMGAAGNILMRPFDAILVGALAGLASIAGFQIITPMLDHKFGIHDTRGVLSLHGIPGMIGSVASAIFLIFYPDSSFPESSKILAADRGRGSQAGAQLLGLLTAVLTAIISGVITGFILKLKVWSAVNDKSIFSDTGYFDVPEDYEFTTRVISHIDTVQVHDHPLGRGGAGAGTTSGAGGSSALVPTEPSAPGKDTSPEKVNLTSAEATEGH